MFQSLLKTFLNPPCPLCQRSAQPLLCLDCERQMDDCQLAAPERSASPVFAWGTYAGVLKRAIHVMKYENSPDIAQMLGQKLGQRWLAQPTWRAQAANGSLVVVPVPLHRDRLRQRGYNQAELIASQFSRVTGLPCLPQGLLRVKATAAQHQLSPKDRQHNLKGAFRLGPDWSIERMQSRVLLIDDIYTTGTTARAAAIELRHAGLRVLGVATAARASLSRSGAALAAV
ncbi:MAG: ComF family protein [Cyanobacteria bacterium J06628_6]